GSPAPAPPGRGRSERRGVVATAGAAAGPGVAALLAAVAALSAVRGSGRVAATSAAVLPATDLLRLRRCPAERHRNLVRVELPAVAVVTGLAILPLLRLERPGRGDPVALADGLGDALGLVPPHGDAETVLRLIDVLVALLLALRLHRLARRVRDAGLREPHLGVVREVVGDGEGLIGHGSGLLLVRGQGLSLLGEVRQPSRVV